MSYISLIFIILSFCYIGSCTTADTDDQLTPPDSVTIYFSGNPQDLRVTPKGGIVMMGGNTENDHAMKWFLQQANGGDVLILRASGSDGYQSYLFEELGVTVNSVQTIVFHSLTVSEYVLDNINKAEAIWFAGGNQKIYLDYWKGNAIQTALQRAIDRGVVMGGTSAGMAILGEYIWDGESIRTDFLNLPFMENTITDTHYDARNRMSRHLEFISQINGKGIAADEFTAICIHADGNAYVFGNEDEEDYAYFIRRDLSFIQVRGSSTGTFALNIAEW